MGIMIAPKLQFSERISALLEVHGFHSLDSDFLWGRQVNGVIQVVRGDFSRWGNLGLKVFSIDTKDVYLGGELSHITIDDHFDRGGVWILEEDKVEVGLMNISSALTDIAHPWLTVFNNPDSIRSGYSLNEYSQRHDRSKEIEKIVKLESIEETRSKWRSTAEIETLISTVFEPTFSSLGFDEFSLFSSNKNYWWMRQRGEIYDFINIVRLNSNVHLGCKLYRWISELSITGKKEISKANQVSLIGGMLNDKQFHSFDKPVLATLSETHLTQSFEVFIAAIAEELSVIEKIVSSEDFYRSIPNKPEYRALLKQLGLGEKP